MEQLLNAITSDSENFIMFLIFGVGGTIGGVIAVTAIVLGTRHNVKIAKEKEITRREIAAYIAEGSMTPEQGERLLVAGNDKKA